MTSIFLAAAMLLAQSTGSSSMESDLSTKETRAVVHAYAACIVKRQPAKAAEAIQRNVDNGIMMREYPKLFDGGCLTRGPMETLQARFGGDLYRYAIADALVRHDLSDFARNDFSAVPRLDHREPTAPAEVDRKGKKLSAKNYEASLASYEKSRAFSYLSRYGECVVRLDPAAAQTLLLTKPDTADEAVRFKAMIPALSTCLPEGQTLSFGKVALRGTIAVNYYRLAMAARSTATGTAG
jgi:hypothetical protein